MANLPLKIRRKNVIQARAIAVRISLSSSHCEKPLLGSASRSCSDKYYPAYHCGKKNDHSFRVSKKELEEKADTFFGHFRLSPEHIDKVFGLLEGTWQELEAEYDERVAQWISASQLSKAK